MGFCIEKAKVTDIFEIISQHHHMSGNQRDAYILNP